MFYTRLHLSRNNHRAESCCIFPPVSVEESEVSLNHKQITFKSFSNRASTGRPRPCLLPRTRALRALTLSA